ncbi:MULTISPECIES: hypothetical protein [Streptomyces]|nr:MULTISPECIES: hypothetical protein [Streptomyces]
MTTHPALTALPRPASRQVTVPTRARADAQPLLAGRSTTGAGR